MKVTKETFDEGSHIEFSIWYNENGKLHREDGPARTFIDGKKEWWINGKSFNTEEDYKTEMYNRNLLKLQETN